MMSIEAMGVRDLCSREKKGRYAYLALVRWETWGRTPIGYGTVEGHGRHIGAWHVAEILSEADYEAPSLHSRPYRAQSCGSDSACRPRT
jgi:hypothetical protein